MLITRIVLESANRTKILFSSSLFFDGLENFKVKRLRSLSKQMSVELFLKKIPI